MTSYPNRAGHTPLRSAKVRAALEYAARGWPVFPCKPGGKEPLTKRGHLDASTDTSRIHAWWNRWPDANIGIPTGERSGILALDVDQPAGLDELEAEHGELPATRTHATGSGGMHYLFTYPAEEEIRNSAGKLAEGLDVRGEGGYIIVPPSSTTRPYEVLDDLPLADPPAWLIDLIRGERADKQPMSLSAPRGSSVRAVGDAAKGTGPIPEGQRNNTLTSIAGRLHDGTRDLEALVCDLLEVNASRCEPPLPDGEVEGIADSIYKKPPCRPSKNRDRDPQVDEVLDAASGDWWERLVPGGGRAKRRDVHRALVTIHREHGWLTTVTVDGEERRAVACDPSFRQVALKANTGVGSVSRAMQLFTQRGIIQRDDSQRKAAKPGIILLIEPAPKWNTSSIEAELGSCSTNARPPRADELSTPTPRWGDPGIGNARAGILYVLEAFGEQTAKEIAKRVGVRRARDLKRRHLEPLERLGLVEYHDEKWQLARAYQKRAEMVCTIPYATIKRERHRSTSPEGRRVCSVVESEIVASAEERQQRDAQRFKEQSDRYRNPHEVKADPLPKKPQKAPDGEISELEKVKDATPELVEALAAYLHRNPRRAGETPSWLAVALWAEELVEGKPTAAAVEVALYDLDHDRAA